MKPVFAALVILALASPATSQGNSPPAHSYRSADPAPAAPIAAPMSYLAQRALAACPDLLARTESAVASGHIQNFFSGACECAARSIDYNTWNDSTASYDGPPMPESDSIAIINAFLASPTIDDAFSEIESTVSQTGFSALSACFVK